jgi:hypothetical protein
MCAATPRSLVPSPVPARSSADMPSSWPELPSCTLRRAAILGRSCPSRSSGELPLSPPAAAAGCWLLLRPATSGAAAIIHAEASCHHPRRGELPSSSRRRAAIILAEASCHHPPPSTPRCHRSCHPRGCELPSSSPRRAAIILAEASCHHPHRGQLPSSSLRRAAILGRSCPSRSSGELPLSPAAAAAGCWLLAAAEARYLGCSCHHPHGGELPSSTRRRVAIILAEASCHHPRGGELPSSSPRRAAIIHTEASCHHPRGGELPSSLLR